MDIAGRLRGIHMRLSLCAALAAMTGALALQAGAAQAGPVAQISPYQQYAAANALWFGLIGDDKNYTLDYPKAIADGLTGKWFDISALQLTADDPAAIAKACDKLPFNIVARDQLTFRMVVHAGEDDENATLFTSLGGDAYNVSVDPAAAFHYLGVDKAKTSDELPYEMLRSMTGAAIVQRPSPDLLVVQINSDLPRAYARCPKV